jgi:hypothetical protein
MASKDGIGYSAGQLELFAETADGNRPSLAGCMKAVLRGISQAVCVEADFLH